MLGAKRLLNFPKTLIGFRHVLLQFIEDRGQLPDEHAAVPEVLPTLKIHLCRV